MPGGPGKIMIGTSGFAYDEWVGRFYPAHLRRDGFLDYYASRFPALEINGTYYRTPELASAERMVRGARGRLLFAIKAPGAFTHEGDAAALQPFLRYVAPFADGGVLAAILLQFPGALRPDAEGSERLRRAAALLKGLPLVAEFRSSLWDDHPLRSEALARGFSLAVVDQPSLPSLGRSLRRAEGPLRYLRFHGRNSAQWFTGDNRTRYEYSYNEREMDELERATRTDAPAATTTLAFFNNHAHGAAAENAVMLMERLGIAPVAHPHQGDLFGF
jgi:uncharacterized protein YecE (DUF72 family)